MIHRSSCGLVQEWVTFNHILDDPKIRGLTLISIKLVRSCEQGDEKLTQVDH